MLLCSDRFFSRTGIPRARSLRTLVLESSLPLKLALVPRSWSPQSYQQPDGTVNDAKEMFYPTHAVALYGACCIPRDRCPIPFVV